MGEADGAVSTVEFATEEVTNREPAPPAWLQEQEAAPLPPKDTPESAETNDLVLSYVVDFHGQLADTTHYEGWRLTEARIELWRKSLRFLLRRLPVKDWPEILALAMLAMSEGMTVIGYLRFRRTMNEQNPVKAPEGETS